MDVQASSAGGGFENYSNVRPILYFFTVHSPTLFMSRTKGKDCSRLFTIRSLPFCFYYLGALIRRILHLSLSLILTWTPQHKFPNQIDLQNINFNSHPLPKKRKNAVHAEPPWQLWPSSVRFRDNPSSSSHPRVCTLL